MTLYVKTQDLQSYALAEDIPEMPKDLVNEFAISVALDMQKLWTSQICQSMLSQQISQNLLI